MCLCKTHWLPKISMKPIQVYKQFLYMELYAKWTEDKEEYLVTPFQQTRHNVGDTIIAKDSWVKGVFADEISSEGVHAYIAHPCTEQMILDGKWRFFWYICEIPPYTPYWIGKHGDIAASKMIIKERL